MINMHKISSIHIITIISTIVVVVGRLLREEW